MIRIVDNAESLGLLRCLFKTI